MQSMPSQYRPSFSSGIYGSYIAHQTLIEMEEKEQKYQQQRTAAVTEIKQHRTLAADFSIINIPQSVKSKPKERQLATVAGMYKKMLFDHMPKKKNLGGWLLLSMKNMKNNNNSKMKSPQELGYSIIEPKYMGDPVYAKSMIRFIRDDIITLKSCVGLSGSFYTTQTYDNNSDQEAEFTILKGQVFEQNRFRKVQNLAAIGFYKTQPSVPPAKIEMKGSDMVITLPPNARDIKINIECHCIDHHHSGPNGEPMNATPLRCDAAVNATNQQATWDALDADEANDIFD